MWLGCSKICQVISLCESDCSEGQADLVYAHLSKANAPGRILGPIADLLRQPSCSRILSTLKPRAPRNEAFLRERVGVTAQTLRFWLKQLLEARLIQASGADSFVLGSRFVIPELEICSFEFKLQNWRRALYQATRYRVFSHRVYVVMPPESMNPALENLALFRRLNVGLVSHDRAGQTRAILQASKKPPISRHRLIMALGMLLSYGD